MCMCTYDTYDTYDTNDKRVEAYVERVFGGRRRSERRRGLVLWQLLCYEFCRPRAPYSFQAYPRCIIFIYLFYFFFFAGSTSLFSTLSRRAYMYESHLRLKLGYVGKLRNSVKSSIVANGVLCSRKRYFFSHIFYVILGGFVVLSSCVPVKNLE